MAIFGSIIVQWNDDWLVCAAVPSLPLEGAVRPVQSTTHGLLTIFVASYTYRPGSVAVEG